jgi:hypothetical protein
VPAPSGFSNTVTPIHSSSVECRMPNRKPAARSNDLAIDCRRPRNIAVGVEADAVAAADAQIDVGLHEPASTVAGPNHCD